MPHRETLRISLAQINCTVGDIAGNCSRIEEFGRRARLAGADIALFPELSVTGYPPEDLLLKPDFVRQQYAATKALARSLQGLVAVVGFIDARGGQLFNAAAVMAGGRIRGIYHKQHLPNYGVFDEKRYFSAGAGPLLVRWGALVFGVNICEDIWARPAPEPLRRQLSPASLLLTINASPYHTGKIIERQRIIRSQARHLKAPIAYVNLVGGQDELVFDGQSMVVDAGGKILARAAAFREDLLSVDIGLSLPRGSRSSKPSLVIPGSFNSVARPALPPAPAVSLSPEEEVYQALLLGLRDYVSKNGFSKVVVGLSGGIDSALVAVLAVDALGRKNVTAVFMPSRYSSAQSQCDAQAVAQNLGIACIQLSIEPIYKVYLIVLEQHFAGFKRDSAEENLQARIRGNLLMALSNKFGWLVLTTGNKSEMSTGYATLYGDMAGGFAVIKDVPKMLVYRLARYRNGIGAVIPETVLTKAPTAELKPHQRDSDTLPPYELLDEILQAYIEKDRELQQIVGAGFDRAVVSRVLSMVDRSEYKRRQAPPGIKITPKAFGRDRRMPITNRYRSY